MAQRIFANAEAAALGWAGGWVVVLDPDGCCQGSLRNVILRPQPGQDRKKAHGKEEGMRDGCRPGLPLRWAWIRAGAWVALHLRVMVCSPGETLQTHHTNSNNDSHSEAAKGTYMMLESDLVIRDLIWTGGGGGVLGRPLREDAFQP